MHVVVRPAAQWGLTCVLGKAYHLRGPEPLFSTQALLHKLSVPKCSEAVRCHSLHLECALKSVWHRLGPLQGLLDMGNLSEVVPRGSAGRWADALEGEWGCYCWDLRDGQSCEWINERFSDGSLLGFPFLYGAQDVQVSS